MMDESFECAGERLWRGSGDTSAAPSGSRPCTRTPRASQGAPDELQKQIVAAHETLDAILREQDELSTRATELRTELADLEQRAEQATEALASAERRLAKMGARLG